MSWPPPPWNQFGPPSPLKLSAALEPIAPWMLLSVSVSLPRLAVPATRSIVTAVLPPKRARSIPSPPSSRSLPGPPSSTSLPPSPRRMSLPARPRTRSAPALAEIVLAPSVPVSTSLLGEARGRERLVALGGADVGQAAGGQRPGGADLVGRQGGQRVAAAQRRVGDAVAQGDDAGGVELPAAGVGVDGWRTAGWARYPAGRR